MLLAAAVCPDPLWELQHSSRSLVTAKGEGTGRRKEETKKGKEEKEGRERKKRRGKECITERR